MAGKKYEVYVQKGRPWWKLITGILFSHLGELSIVNAYLQNSYRFKMRMILSEYSNDVYL